MIKLRPSKQDIKDIFEYIIGVNQYIANPHLNDEELKAAADIVAAYVETGFCNTLDPNTHFHLHLTYDALKMKGLIK